MVDLGLPPERFARVWIHTHPGNSASPSCVDEETFVRSFGRSDWALMFILAQGGQTTARLRFHVGPGGDCELPVDVDFFCDFAAPNRTAWKEEYQRCVCVPPPPITERLPRNDVFDRASDMLVIDEENFWDDRFEEPSLIDEPFAEEVVYG